MMISGEQYLILGLVILSHMLALRRFWRRIRRRTLPSVADFACVSLVLFYDIGLLLEVSGWGGNSYFAPLLEGDTKTLTWALILLVTAPWLFRAGERLSRGRPPSATLDELSTLRPSRRLAFYALVTLTVAPLGLLGAIWLSSGDAIWVMRGRLGEALGPLMIALYVPMYVLGFYVRQADSRTPWGRLFSCMLVGASILSTCAYGQRTTVLLPLLILALFAARVSLSRVTVVALAGVVAASVILPTFKWQFASGSRGTTDLIANTLVSDLSRSGVLRKAIELSDNVGTQVMSYPLEGYVYGALLFVPRPLISFKGQSTARRFTSFLESTPVDETDWGFGVGVIEEATVNGGLMLAAPILLIIGVGMGLLQRGSRAFPSIAVPTRLAALWCGGYHFPALVLVFGGMTLCGLLLNWLFVLRVSSSSAAVSATPDVPWSMLGTRPGTC